MYNSKIYRKFMIFGLIGFLILFVGGCGLIAPEAEPPIDEAPEDVVRERDELEERIEELESKLAEKQEQLEAAEADREQARQELEELEEKQQQLEELREQNKELEQSLAEVKDAEARLEGENVIVTLDSEILFDFGDHRLRSESRQTLEDLAGIIADHQDRMVAVEGHTCTVPVLPESQFPSNWHLSAARAVSVVEYLTEEHDLDSEQFFAGGYGEFRPVASNQTEEERVKNRRVEIVFYPPGIEREVLPAEEVRE